MQARFRSIRVDTTKLLFDPNNPRFQGDFTDFVFTPTEQIGDAVNQSRALERLQAAQFGIRQLAESIAQVGFLPVDAMVVTRYDKTRYLVIEGNRRLAALRLVLDGTVEYKAGEVKSLKKIQVLLLQEPQDLAVVSQWVIQGTRHVGGIKAWGPYQQAKAIQILQREQGLNPSEAAAVLGLKPTEANRTIRALSAFEALQEHPFFGPKSRPDHFSFMDEMAWKPALREYFGWSNTEQRFVDERRRDFFFTLFVGDSRTNTPPKLKSALQLRDVPAILENPEARESFEDLRQPFERASYLASVPPSMPVVPEIVARLRIIVDDLKTVPREKFSVEEKKILMNVREILDSILEHER